MLTIPIGYLVTVMLLLLMTCFALKPPLPKHSSPSNLSYWLGFLINELPFTAFFYLAASTILAFVQDDINSSVSWVIVGMAAITACGIIVIAWRGLQSGPVIQRALNEALGDEWQDSIPIEMVTKLRRRLPWGRILFIPFFVHRWDVKHIANIRYGDAGKRNLLDIYRHRSNPSNSPVLVYLHGGAFRSGRKNREARPLLYRLASQGWLCISANYRLNPAAAFPDHLIDLKKILAWVREYGQEYGANPELLFVSGSSAGGHLASIAALTENDPAFQPGFEEADTSVTAAISLYGYYGSASSKSRQPSTPHSYIKKDAPPFFVAHGDQDTIVIVEDARKFVNKLRANSTNPVVYAELPGAQHSFDLFHSLRFDAVVDGIESFASWVRTHSEI